MVATRSAVKSVPRRPRTKFTYVKSAMKPQTRRRATFNFTRIPTNVLLNIMRRLTPRNAVSAKTALPKRNATQHALTGMKLKNLLNMGKHNHARYFSPTLKKIVEGITENNNTVGYHRRRVKNSQAMLNALRLANNGFYSRGGTGTNKYRYNKRYGGTLSSVRGGTTRVVMKGIKRTPNGTGLMLKH